MIKIVRVDHRLIHGQVAFSWSKFLDLDAILIPSDEIANNELRKNLLRMAKPPHMKLVIKNMEDSIKAINSGVTDKYNLMILCESVEDAYELVKNVKDINSINLGGMKDGKDRKQISKAVHLSKLDIDKIVEMNDSGVEIYIQMVPDDKKENVMNFI